MGYIANMLIFVKKKHKKRESYKFINQKQGIERIVAVLKKRISGFEF